MDDLSAHVNSWTQQFGARVNAAQNQRLKTYCGRVVTSVDEDCEGDGPREPEDDIICNNSTRMKGKDNKQSE